MSSSQRSSTPHKSAKKLAHTPIRNSDDSLADSLLAEPRTLSYTAPRPSRGNYMKLQEQEEYEGNSDIPEAPEEEEKEPNYSNPNEPDDSHQQSAKQESQHRSTQTLHRVRDRSIYDRELSSTFAAKPDISHRLLAETQEDEIFEPAERGSFQNFFHKTDIEPQRPSKPFGRHTTVDNFSVLEDYFVKHKKSPPRIRKRVSSKGKKRPRFISLDQREELTDHSSNRTPRKGNKYFEKHVDLVMWRHNEDNSCIQISEEPELVDVTHQTEVCEDMMIPGKVIALGGGKDQMGDALKTVLERDLRVVFMLDRGKIRRIKIMNLIAMLVLLICAGVIYFFFKDNDIFSQVSYTRGTEPNPFVMLQHLDVLSWVAILLFLGLFAVMPLCNVRENFDVLLFQKVGYRYMALCFLLASYAALYSLGQQVSKVFITPAFAIGVKVFTHFALYARLKYHDDGHDFVSRLQFISLHLTISLLSAWLSYICAFSLFNSISQNSKKESHQFPEGSFLNLGLPEWEAILQVLLFSEAAIYLADFKDIFFSLIVVAVFLGEYLQSKTQEAMEFYPHSQVLALSFAMVILGFLLLTLTCNFRSVFYLKHDVLVQSLHDASGKRQHAGQEPEDAKFRASSFLTGAQTQKSPVLMSSILERQESSIRRKSQKKVKRNTAMGMRGPGYSRLVEESQEEVEKLSYGIDFSEPESSLSPSPSSRRGLSRSLKMKIEPALTAQKVKQRTSNGLF